jgi:repressor LexA
MDTVNSFGPKLKALRLYRGLSQEELATRIKTSKQVISRYETGQRVPKITVVKQFADDLNVPISYFLEEDHDSAHKKTRFVPVLGNVPAGIPLEAIENILDYEEISQDMSNRGEYFGLVVHGDSMEPKFSEGDVVIVRKQSVLESGEIGIIIVNGTDATIKKFVSHEEGGISLIPLNPKYAPKYYTNGEIDTVPIRVLGKVVELRAKF